MLTGEPTCPRCGQMMTSGAEHLDCQSPVLSQQVEAVRRRAESAERRASLLAELTPEERAAWQRVVDLALEGQRRAERDGRQVGPVVLGILAVDRRLRALEARAAAVDGDESQEEASK